MHNMHTSLCILARVVSMCAYSTSSMLVKMCHLVDSRNLVDRFLETFPTVAPLRPNETRPFCLQYAPKHQNTYHSMHNISMDTG